MKQTAFVLREGCVRGQRRKRGIKTKDKRNNTKKVKTTS